MARNLNPYALLPVLLILVSFILSLLVIFAGNSPSFMHEYSVLTLNTTRLGQNVVEKIDSKIMGFNLSKMVNKRSELASVHATITSSPVATITMAPRDFDSIISGLTADAASIQSNAGNAVDSVQSAVESKATAVASAVESKASSVEGVVASKISSAIGAAQTAVVDSINTSYADFIDELDLKGFYSIHMRTTCEGEYVTPSGQNITVGDSAFPPNGTHMRTDSCEKHSALNILSAVSILFEIGIFFVGICLLLGTWAAISFSKKKATLCAVAALPAVGFLALASAATHVLARAGAAAINFVGEGVGLEASYGGRFIALIWSATILVLINASLWTALAFIGEKLPIPRSGARTGGALPEHEMKKVYANESRDSSVQYVRENRI